MSNLICSKIIGQCHDNSKPPYFRPASVTQFSLSFVIFTMKRIQFLKCNANSHYSSYLVSFRWRSIRRLNKTVHRYEQRAVHRWQEGARNRKTKKNRPAAQLLSDFAIKKCLYVQRSSFMAQVHSTDVSDVPLHHSLAFDIFFLYYFRTSRARSI